MKQCGLSQNCDARLSIFATCFHPIPTSGCCSLDNRSCQTSFIACSIGDSQALVFTGSRPLTSSSPAPTSTETMSAVPLLVICLVMLASADVSNAECTYNVTLVTGSTNSASTNKDVMFKLHDGTLSTPWVLLHNKGGARFQRNSKVKVSFNAVCLTKPCVTLRVTKTGDAWYAQSLKIEVPDVRCDVVINNFQFDIAHWITMLGYSTCAFDKTAYVAFGRQV